MTNTTAAAKTPLIAPIDVQAQFETFFASSTIWIQSNWMKILIAFAAGAVIVIALHAARRLGRRLCDREGARFGWGSVVGRAIVRTNNFFIVMLAAKLVQLAPAGFNRVFFTGSGSEANDTIVRMVRRYWELMEEPERHIIISRNNAYHGSTIAGVSLGGMAGMHAQGGPLLPGIVHIDQPSYLEHGHGMSEDEFGVVAAGWLEERIKTVGPHNVAAFIAEPVQGAGGVIIPPTTYWPEIQRICDKYGILLIADEVICGFGRLGAWFGSERMGIKPDLIAFAKGVTSGYIPLGGVLVGDRVADVLTARGGDFNHGFTYSGHPVACAAALENIRIMEEEGLIERVLEDTGPYLNAAFKKLAAHPLVGYADSFGFVAGLNLVRRKGASVHENEVFDGDLGVGMLCRAHMFEAGIIMRAVGDRMIIAPPLVMTRAEIDEMVGRITLALDNTLAELQAKELLVDAAVA